METADETLAARAAQGDGEAFATLLSRHYDSLYRIGYRVLGNRADAEDLAQEICVSLPRKLAGFAGRARFSTWLYRIAINAARDMIRRNSHARRKAEGWGEMETLRRAEAAQAAEEQAWLQRAMTRLPQDLRETVALVLGEEMTHAEAAAVLSLSEGTVSWRMSEVRRLLRDFATEEERPV